MDSNNENPFPSQLPQPRSKGSSPRKSGNLKELSGSDNNARSSHMPPPQNLGKRKTPASGSIGRPAPVPPSLRPTSAAGKLQPTASISRHTSYASSVSSMRMPSTTSTRNVSNCSLSSGTGSNYRTPSLQSSRPQSALAGPGKPFQSAGRSSSALAAPTTGHELARPVRKREGRSQFPFRSNGLPLGPSGPNGPNERGRNGRDEAPASHPSAEADQKCASPSIRDISLSSAMNVLSLEDSTPFPTCTIDRDGRTSPSKIPVMQTPLPNATLPPKTCTAVVEAVSPCRSSKKPPAPTRRFLNRESNIEIAMDAEIQFENFSSMFSGLQDQLNGITTDRNGMKELIAIHKTQIEDLETTKTDLQSQNRVLQTELDAVKGEVSTSATALEDCKRYHHIALDDLHRQHRRDLDDAQRDKEEDLRRELRRHQDEVSDMRRQLEDALEQERSLRQKEIRSLTSEGEMSQQRMDVELEKQQRMVRSVQNELEQSQATVTQQRNLNNDLRAQLSEAASSALRLETSMSSLKAHITFLESDNKSQSQAFADLEMRMQNAIRSAAEANDKLRTEETLRRKLHNQVQELKGNIRVFCRVRPSLEADSEAARIRYPDTESDSKEVEVQGPPEKSSLGTVTTKTNAFAFDRVFGPQSVNADVFGEISQLIQSALDGYNVCIFCYGQTGSGKTYTMSSTDGMIPLAVNQIYDTAKSLEEKGWKYTMEGSFVEVYNENLNDLLGKADDIDKKKHEIRHDMQKCKTIITDIEVVDLDTPNKVESILRRASANRSVAATNANERSSRSHSVFILKLIGENAVTGERSEGTLNLVDLAGSERLSHSGATGERLKETQSINKSLSCLGDVIGALGQGKEGGHVPYRNSKLTYLLQFSLGGNSKTLMFVMISPLQAHLSETLTSLKFATKVHNTHIGTAKRQTKTKD